MRFLMVTAAACAMASCGNPPTGGDASAFYRGNLIFYNFAGELVTFSVNGDTIFREPLSVSAAEESTGFSKSLAIDLPECSLFELDVSDRIIQEEVCVRRDDFEIFVNPSAKPFFKVTYGETGLD